MEVAAQFVGTSTDITVSKRYVDELKLKITKCKEIIRGVVAAPKIKVADVERALGRC